MRYYLLSIILLILSAFPQRVVAQCHVDVDSVQVWRNKDSVQVSMKIQMNTMHVDKSDLLWLTPRLVNGKDSIEFPTVCIYGRNTYYSYIRTGPYANYADMQIRGKRQKDPIPYIQNLSYQKWMDGAKLVMACAQTNSCGNIVCEAYKTAYTPPKPTYRPRPEDEMTRRAPVIHSRSGVAHIDFILDSIVIHPEYHDNTAELNKIKATIDSVINDPNANPKLLTIHGYASPEGPYNHNVWLSQERTKALARYVNGIYKFPEGFIQTDNTPEDWDGLIKWLEQCMLPHRKELLDISNSNRKPDAKMWLIKQRYPAEYQIMLKEILPYLRHSDYRIDYTLRSDMRRFEEEEARKAITMPRMPQRDTLLPTAPLLQFQPYKPILALKTNLLFDLALCANIEVEVPFGHEQKYSLMAEYWTPWYVWQHNSRAFEFQAFGFELRRWFRSCRKGLPPLSGPFVGAYYANGKYDLEWNGEGNQGEFNSAGLTWGYSWVLNRHLNFEASLSGGVFWGPRRHYTAQYDNSHLIWQYTGRTFYAGPTKAKLSLVWLMGPSKKIRRPQPEPVTTAYNEGLSPQPVLTVPQRKASTPPQPQLEKGGARE